MGIKQNTTNSNLTLPFCFNSFLQRKPLSHSSQAIHLQSPHSVCVCVYICIYMCVCVYICVCMCICICVYMCVCVYVYMCIYVCLYVHMFMYICLWVYISLYDIKQESGIFRKREGRIHEWVNSDKRESKYGQRPWYIWVGEEKNWVSYTLCLISTYKSVHIIHAFLGLG